MKKEITLLVMIVFVATSAMAQRISLVTAKHAVTNVEIPIIAQGALSNPKNNNALKPGTWQLVFPQGTDLTKVALTFDAGATCVLTNKYPLTEDISKTFKIELENTTTATPPVVTKAEYDIESRILLPSSALDFSVEKANIVAWAPETIGWAPAGTEVAATGFVMKSDRRGLVFAIDYAPSTLTLAACYLNDDLTFVKGELNVNESADGITWTDAYTFSDDKNTALVSSKTTPTPAPIVANLKSTTRYLQVICKKRPTEKVPVNPAKPGSANVALSQFTVAKSSEEGLSNNLADQVTLFPVPAVDVITISAPQAIASVVLTNIAGQTVLSSNAVVDRLTISTLAVGYYNALITFADGTQVCKRIIKQ